MFLSLHRGVTVCKLACTIHILSSIRTFIIDLKRNPEVVVGLTWGLDVIKTQIFFFIMPLFYLKDTNYCPLACNLMATTFQSPRY